VLRLNKTLDILNNSLHYAIDETIYCVFIRSWI